LGLALNTYLSVTCSTRPSGLAITANNPELATDGSNLIVRAMAALFEAAEQPLPGLELDIANDIPLARGLGSSAAAIVAGLLLANRLCGDRFDSRGLLRIGLPLEGHADNLAPALLGGLCISAAHDGDVLALKVTLRTPPGIALFIPDFAIPTSDARRVLPDRVPRVDAVFNAGRAALLVAALAQRDWSALRWAMEDRLHQPYREAIFPDLPRLIEAALDAGAAGAAMSGAGSTIIALCSGDPAPVAAALENAGVPGRSAIARIDTKGAAFRG
jgi:homoserine kinase